MDIDISNDSIDPVDDGFDINKVSYCSKILLGYQLQQAVQWRVNERSRTIPARVNRAGGVCDMATLCTALCDPLKIVCGFELCYCRFKSSGM